VPDGDISTSIIALGLRIEGVKQRIAMNMGMTTEWIRSVVSDGQLYRRRVGASMYGRDYYYYYYRKKRLIHLMKVYRGDKRLDVESRP